MKLPHQHHPSGIACPETEKIRHRSAGRKIPWAKTLKIQKTKSPPNKLK